MRGSRYTKERTEAVKLRRSGLSISDIEEKLGINRSTLSGWFKDIVLTKSQIEHLSLNQQMALRGAQVKAATWHRAQKRQRIIVAQSEAASVLRNLDLRNRDILDLALAMLYWGEGFKKELGVGIGNTDPDMLRFLIHVLRENYQVPNSKLTAQLHLRADQNETTEVSYWSKALGIPKGNFKWTQFDKRTAGYKTYENYHGVCTVYCHNVAIQRKLLNISKQFMLGILEKKRA